MGSRDCAAGARTGWDGPVLWWSCLELQADFTKAPSQLCPQQALPVTRRLCLPCSGPGLAYHLSYLQLHTCGRVGLCMLLARNRARISGGCCWH